MLEWIWKKCYSRDLYNYCNACFYVTLGLFIFILIGITFWTFSRPIYGSAKNEIEYENSDYYSKRGLSIIDTKPKNGYIVKEGTSVTLSCKTNFPWSFCKWEGPNSFECKTNGPKEKSCNERIILESLDRKNCKIDIRKFNTAQDHGIWKCTSKNRISSDSKEISLEALKPATIQLSLNHEYFGSKMIIIPMHIKEGQTRTIKCEGNGSPIPKIEWHSSDCHFKLLRNKNSKNSLSINYTAVVKDDGKEIKCSATQFNIDGKTIYKSLAIVKLNVERSGESSKNKESLTLQLAIILGTIVSILSFIGIIFVAICMFKYERKRRDGDQNNANKSEKKVNGMLLPKIKISQTRIKPSAPPNETSEESTGTLEISGETEEATRLNIT